MLYMYIDNTYDDDDDNDDDDDDVVQTDDNKSTQIRSVAFRYLHKKFTYFRKHAHPSAIYCKDPFVMIMCNLLTFIFSLLNILKVFSGLKEDFLLIVFNIKPFSKRLKI